MPVSYDNWNTTTNELCKIRLLIYGVMFRRCNLGDSVSDTVNKDHY